jgi:hypothetical protein
MLLVVKLAKLRVVGLRNAFRPKFNIHAFTRFSIYKGVYKLIYYTSLRHLGKWVRH